MMAPWPDPVAKLTAVVGSDDRATTTFTVTGAKQDGAYQIDPGDGGPTVPVTITKGTGTATHRYSRPGHHTYTASVTLALPPWAATWADVPTKAETWELVPGLVTTWDYVSTDSETVTASVTVDVGDATIWAQVIQDQPLPYVQVSTWIGKPEDVVSWVITRSAPRAPSVMSVDIHVGDKATGSYSLEDRECPVAQEVTYTLTAKLKNGSTITATSNPVTILGTRGCFLTDTASGRTVAITLQAWDERKREARQSVLDVINRASPVVRSDTHLTPAGTWSLKTRTEAELDAVTDVLTASRLVLLRTQPLSAIATTYAAVGEINEVRLYAGDGKAWDRLVSVAVQEVDPIPATARQLHIDWDRVAATYATWTALAADMPTWQDVTEWNPDA